MPYGLVLTAYIATTTCRTLTFEVGIQKFLLKRHSPSKGDKMATLYFDYKDAVEDYESLSNYAKSVANILEFGERSISNATILFTEAEEAQRQNAVAGIEQTLKEVCASIDEYAGIKRSRATRMQWVLLG